MTSLERKVARLEGQNATLRQKVRKQASVINRFSVRESQIKQTKQLQVLRHRLSAARGECEELLVELAKRRTSEANLLEELRILRNFVATGADAGVTETTRWCTGCEVGQGKGCDPRGRPRASSEERKKYRERISALYDKVEYFCSDWPSHVPGRQQPEGGDSKDQAEGKAVAEDRRSPLTSGVVDAASGSGVCVGEPLGCVLTGVGFTNTLRCSRGEGAVGEAPTEVAGIPSEELNGNREERSRQEAATVPEFTCQGSAVTKRMDLAVIVQSLRRKLCLSERMRALFEARWSALSEENRRLSRRLTEEGATVASLKNELRNVYRECEQLRGTVAEVLKVKLLSSQRLVGPSCGTTDSFAEGWGKRPGA